MMSLLRLALAWLLLSVPSIAVVLPGACLDQTAQTERTLGLPAHVLAAISTVESGPWPWTINVDGQGMQFETREEAIEATRRAIVAGARNIDVGCMQISLAHHPDAFRTLEDAFEPAANVAYGGRYLLTLARAESRWDRAIGRYHSSTPALAAEYKNRVLAVWHGLPAGRSRFSPVVYRQQAAEPITSCFTPGQDCTGLIVSAIEAARQQILVQAYSFTSHPIAEALEAAKARGIEVRVIVDGSELTAKNNQARRLAAAGVEVRVDAPEGGIAHNKVMIIDGRIVITGSFNFTEAAQARNAENVLVLNSPDLAAAYFDNWLRRWNVTRSFD